jgi:hypothetical protein
MQAAVVVQDRGCRARPPAIIIRIELEAVPCAFISSETPEEDFALLRWLESSPRGISELLDRVVRDPRALFPWLWKAA